MTAKEEIQLGEVAAALAASFIVKDEQLHLPREALERVRRVVTTRPTEALLVDIASLRAKVEAVAGASGAHVCALLDEILMDGLKILETPRGWGR
jgi:hypothetical protein